MSAWSNIEISPDDSEVVEIDKFEGSLGKVSENVQNVRELITRFEVCHFKYQQHLLYIKTSILNLQPGITPMQIGANHISKGEAVVKNDKSGRSKVGQQYVNSIVKWLGDSSWENSNYFNENLDQRISQWLGDKNPDKERLVRLLLARLTWDWKAYEEYQQKGEHKELESQASRMDICHYAFPEHLDLLLQGIGRMDPIENFEGCGSFNADIKTYIEEQFTTLCEYLKSTFNSKNVEQDEKMKLWLTACLAKTLKEQVGLKEPLPQLVGCK